MKEIVAQLRIINRNLKAISDSLKQEPKEELPSLKCGKCGILLLATPTHAILAYKCPKCQFTILKGDE